MSADADAKAPVADKLSAYLAVLKREAEVYGARPKVELKCDFSYTLSLPASKVDRDIVTVPEVFAGAALAPFKACARAVGAAEPPSEGKDAIQAFPVLQGFDGRFRPGEIALVLAPPGHGKTALLKALAGNLPAGAIDGTVKYGGKTAEELEAEGVSVARLAQYVEQTDTISPFSPSAKPPRSCTTTRASLPTPTPTRPRRSYTRRRWTL